MTTDDRTDIIGFRDGSPIRRHPTSEAPDQEAEVEEICEAMHNAYEAAAADVGWETQERSRKPWSEVPEANKETMRVVVRTVVLPRIAAARVT